MIYNTFSVVCFCGNFVVSEKYCISNVCSSLQSVDNISINTYSKRLVFHHKETIRLYCK